MDKKPLIFVGICAVVLLVLASLSSVIGYQTVEISQRNLIKERMSQKELLFQTITDIINNKEIQRIILKSRMSRIIIAVFDIPLLLKYQLKRIYCYGLLLSKVLSRPKMQSVVRQYQLMNPEIQQGISSVIEKDATLNDEITQLQNSTCDCANNTGATSWSFPFICGILGAFVLLFILIVANTDFGDYMLIILLYLYKLFNCG